MNMITYDIFDEVEDGKIEYFSIRNKNNYAPIDDLIAESISLLNKKGYYTKFCCSGHPDTISSLYVYFERYHEFEDIPDGFKYCYNILRKDFFNSNKEVDLSNNDKIFNEIIELEILKYNDIFLDWVKKLKDIKG